MTKNLIYHCCPLGGYKWNVEQIKKRWHVFDGIKIVAIATGLGLDPVDKVKALFPPDVRFIEVQNDRVIRETVSFRPLLEALKKQADPDSVTFYAHSKGISHRGPLLETIRLWTTLMYQHNLDNQQKVDEHLEQYPITGCFRRNGKFKVFPKDAGPWHYSGTFFWFRNADVFSRSWFQIAHHQYGTEIWPGVIFRKEEAGCLFGESVANPYDIKEMRKLARLPV